MVCIETPRLILRDWKEEDFIPFAEMNGNPSVMEFFLHPLSGEESRNLFDTVRNEFLQYGYGGYAIDVDFAPGIEILWRLRQEYWGRGYATEAAKSCLAYAKENLPFSMVRAFTSLTNKHSQRVMQKIGMEFEKNFMHPAVPDGHLLKEHVLYKIQL